MESSVLEDLKNQVQCLLCNETMDEPKLLQCFHIFCKSCIRENAQLEEEVNIFKCPQCTSPTILEQLDDVEDLEISPIHSRILQVLSFVENQKVCSVEVSHCEALWKCLDCDCSLCDECLGWHAKFAKNHKVVSLSNLSKEDIESMMKREESCKTHNNQDVEWYCRDCDELICLLCLKDHAHNEHNLSSLQEFITNGNNLLIQLLDRLTTNEEERKQQEGIAVQIRDYGQKAKEKVKKVTKHLVKTLMDHEQNLLAEIEKTITKAERNLRILHHTSAAQEYVKYFAQNVTASEMMKIREGKRSTKITYEPFQKDAGGINFNPNEELHNQVNTGLGHVKIFTKADATLCSLKVEPNIEAMKTTKLTVVMKTSEGKPADESLDDVTIQITPDDDVQIGEKRMEVDGEATVDLTVRFPGQVTAHVEVRGNPVSNSPVVMNIKPQNIPIKDIKLVKDFNIRLQGYNRGIAVNKTNDRIAVADWCSGCVRVFNMEGDLLLKFGSKGSGHKQYSNPDGLAFLGETNLVIADYGNRRICILDTVKGKTVKTFGCQGNGNGHFDCPRGVCVDDACNIFVCDYGNHRIQVFTKDGDYLYQFNLPDNGNPFDIITHKGLFYVSDQGSSKGVHVIEMKNKRLSSIIMTIGGKDSSDGQLEYPQGLAIDRDSNLLVCDSSKHIYKYTLDGRYIGRSVELGPVYIAALTDGNAIFSVGGGLLAI